MAPEDLVHGLAPSHLAVLCLRGGGADDETIARELDIAAEAVAPMLRLATAKLAAVVTGGTELGDPRQGVTKS